MGNIARLPIDPIRTSVQHVNIEVARLEDMLAAYHRVRDLGFVMAWTVGQHTNDRELSFYCVTPSVTPSGFELEVGKGISIWGHTSTSENVAGLMSRFGAAVRSLRSAEDAVPALSTVPHGARR